MGEKNRFRSIISVVMALTMILSFFSTSVLKASAASDTKGHWAEKEITEWVEQGLIGGYKDGSFKPNAPISRAEFIALVNRAFEFNASGETGFNDVSPNDWYYSEFSKAKAAGYIGGYQDGTIKPKSNITRQEVAAILSRLLEVENDAGAVEQFKDKSAIPEWSKGVVGGIVAQGLMKGFNDGTFKPLNNTTRAEAVVILKRALEGVSSVEAEKVFESAGTYGPAEGAEIIDGNVVITASGVTLQNIVVEGNLTIAEEVGNGEVFLKGVTVKGKTYVNGGGENSVHFEDTVLLTVIVNKADGTVRIVASGKTTVQEVVLQSSARVEQTGTDGVAFDTVTLSEELPANSLVTLIGNFETVDVFAASIAVQIPKGSIQDLNVDENANGTDINLAKEAKILSLVLDAAVKVLGAGVIEKAAVNTDGVNLQLKPKNVNYANGVSQPSTGGGGGGGSSSDDDDNSTGSKDTVAPTIKSLSPVLGAENVPVINDLMITFNENVTAVEGKNIKIYPLLEDEGEIVATETDEEDEIEPIIIPVTDEYVNVSGAVVTIDMWKVLRDFVFPADEDEELNLMAEGTEDSYDDDSYTVIEQVYITIDAGAFKDQAGNEFAGILDSKTWSFTWLFSDEIYSPIKVTSAFEEGEPIPSRYSREGGNVSLPVSWTPVQGAKSYFIVFSDPDADNFIHWAIKDIPGNVTSIAEGMSKTEGMVGTELKNHFETENGFGYGYEGPQPPVKHTYELGVLALDVEKIDIPVDINPTELEDVFNRAFEEGKVIGMGSLGGFFCPKVDGEPISITNTVITSEDNVVDTNGDQLVIEFSKEPSEESKSDILQYLYSQGIGKEDNYWNWEYPNQLWIENTLEAGAQFAIPKDLVTDEYCINPAEDIVITIPATTLSVQGIDFPVFEDTNLEKNVVSGTFEFTKADDETDITHYTVSIVDRDADGYEIDRYYEKEFTTNDSGQYNVTIDNVNVTGYTNLRLEIQPNSGEIYNWHKYRPVTDRQEEGTGSQSPIEQLIEKLGYNNQTKTVNALSDINIESDLGGSAELEVFFSNSQVPTADTVAAGSILLDADQIAESQLIGSLNPSDGDKVWYRLVYSEDNKSEWVQDGIVEYYLVNDQYIVGEFYVLAHEGKVIVNNSGFPSGMDRVNLNGGYKAVVVKNGVRQDPYIIPDRMDAEITVSGDLLAGDEINVFLISPNGNTSNINDNQTVTVLNPTEIGSISVSFGDTTTSDTIQIIGLEEGSNYEIEWENVSGTGPDVGYADASTIESPFGPPLPFGTAVDGIDGATGRIIVRDGSGNTSLRSELITAGPR